MRDLLGYPDQSRVWIYQADRPFDQSVVDAINEEINQFCVQWTSHNNALRAIGGILHDLFLVLVVDETNSSASGCSIDKSVAFVKYLEQKYDRNLLVRDNVAWIDGEEQIQIVPLKALKDKVGSGEITGDTRVFDNLVANRKDFIARWVTRLEDSWMKRFI